MWGKFLTCPLLLARKLKTCATFVCIDRAGRSRFHYLVKSALAGFIFLLATATPARTNDEARVLAKVDPLPVALSDDFEFRKTKLFSLGRAGVSQQAANKRFSGRSRSRASAAVAEASINFESRYRLHGAVTSLDERERSGNYFDFFWRAKRDADITVRFEYRQELLRSFVQAREIRYPNARGYHKTEFAIIGDDFFDDGRVIAWRCLLIENGHIVAENRSYLWK
jgi:hypothetical protein